MRKASMIWIFMALACFLAISAAPPANSEQPVSATHAPIEVHLSQTGEATPSWLKVIEGVTWPAIVLVSVILFRTPLLQIATNIATAGGQFSIGGMAVTIPKLESELRTQNEAILSQQGKIDEQNERIKNLIRFSMSVFIYKMLCDLKIAQGSHGNYSYVNDGSMYRNLRFLIDHGYIQEIHKTPQEGENICPLIVITPSGEDVIAVRGT